MLARRTKPRRDRLSSCGREYITRAPWIMLAPALTIVFTTLAVSMLGDWLRDRLDPTLR